MPSLARISSLLTDQAWALRPEVLESWCQILEAKLQGAGLPQPSAAASGAQGQGATPPEVRDGVALVDIAGTLVKQDYGFGCGTTYGSIREGVQAALDDPRARAILLMMDSPGGGVNGAMETADFLAQAGEQKPLFAYVDGQACSAAYWLASSARLIAAPATAQVGSIGIISMHIDRSALDEKIGLKRTYLSAGAYKAAGHDAAPLADTDRAYLQERLDQTYAIFVDAVAAGRGVTRDKALAMADGKVFMAGPGQTVGLIDQVMGLDQFLTSIKEAIRMDQAELKAQHPELMQAIITDAQKGLIKAEDVQAQLQAAATTERDRVVGLAVALMGEELGNKFKAAVETGVTAEQAKALGATLLPPQASAGQGKQEEILKALQDAHGQGIPPANGDQGAEAGQGQDFMALVKTHQAEHKASLEEAMAAVAKAHPEAHQAYIEAANQKGGK